MIHDDILIEVFDQDLASDDLIGFCSIKVSTLMINAEKGKVEDWFSVFYNNERVGMLRITSEFKGEWQA